MQKCRNLHLEKMVFVLVLICVAMSTDLKSEEAEVKRKLVAKGNREQVLDKQIDELLKKVSNKTIAMLTNPTSVSANMQPVFEVLFRAQKQHNFTVKCFFAPEHGLRGDKQDGSGDLDYVDPITGLWVYSLYGIRKAPQLAQLKGVDLLIYDIQDVGSRFYTFIWTLTYTIEVLAQANIELVVFDRPNVLGRKVQGCPLKIDAGMVGRLLPKQTSSIPQRYGLTIGQLMRYLKPFLADGVWKLSIIEMEEWYEITDGEWVLPSPNMPTLQTALVYPGQVIFESSSLSEGRGTTKPFELSGVPNVNPADILTYFAQNNISDYGKLFNLRESYFIPMFSKHEGQLCGGVQIHVKEGHDAEFNSVETSVSLMKAYIDKAPENSSISISTGVDKLFGRLGTRELILNPKYSAKDILDECRPDLQKYQESYKKYWLYDESGARIKSRQEQMLEKSKPIQEQANRPQDTIKSQ